MCKSNDHRFFSMDGRLSLTIGMVLSLLIFALDIVSPLGIADGMLYVLPVLVCHLAEDPKGIRRAAVMGTILTIAGYYFSPAGAAPWLAVANRGLAILLIWCTTLISMKSIANATRRAEAEAAQSIASARLASTLDIASDAIISIDSEARISSFNKGAEAIFGYTADEMLGRSLDILIPPRLHTVHTRHLADFARSAEVTRTKNSRSEILGRRKDGGEFPAEASISKLMRDDGLTMTVVLRDITERRRREAALEQSEASLRNAQHLASIGSWEWDLATDGLKWSDEHFRILGLKPGSLTPTFDMFMEFVHPEDRPAVQKAAEEAIAERGTATIIHRVVLADGAVRHVCQFGEVVCDRNGAPTAMRGAMQDITDQHEAELALQESERQLRKLANSNPSLVCFVGPDEVYRFVNNTYAKWYGRKADDIVGMTVRELHGEDVYKGLQPRIDKALAGEEVYFESELTDLETGARSIQGHLVPSIDASGNTVGYFVFTNDVTELNRNLNALHQAQKMDAIGQLTGGIAHDFNNLLAVILGNLELAVENEDSLLDAKPRLDAAIGAAERGARLIERLLAFSRQQELAPETVDLNTIIGEMAGLLRQAVGDTIDVAVKPGAGLWRCDVDRSQIENALLNLAINARDAMPRGGQLTIATENCRLDAATVRQFPGAGDGDYIALSISDDGQGMEKETLTHLFEPFFTTKEKGSGTGLGLSMVYGFVERSGGMITVDSAPGQGSTFTIRLPRAGNAAGQSAPSAASPGAAIKSSQEIRGHNT